MSRLRLSFLRGRRKRRGGDVPARVEAPLPAAEESPDPLGRRCTTCGADADNGCVTATGASMDKLYHLPREGKAYPAFSTRP